MSTMLALKPNTKTAIDIIKAISGLEASVSPENLCHFRKQLILSSPEQIFQALFESLSKSKGIQQTHLLLYFYLAFNWTPYNHLEKITEEASKQRFWSSAEDPRFFKDFDESDDFFLNKHLLAFVKQNVEHYSLGFFLRQFKVDPKNFCLLVLENKIGFEGLIFSLQNLKIPFSLLEFIWTRIEKEKTSSPVFGYLLEIVTSKIFEDYIFVKSIFKEAIDLLSEILNSPSAVYFLCLFEELVWKGKKLIELYESRRDYFRENLIKFPAIYCFDPKNLQILNNLLADRFLEIANVKLQLKKFSSKAIEKLSLDYLEKASGEKIEINETRAICDGRDILTCLSFLGMIGGTFKKKKGTLTA